MTHCSLLPAGAWCCIRNEMTLRPRYSTDLTAADFGLTAGFRLGEIRTKICSESRDEGCRRRFMLCSKRRGKSAAGSGGGESAVGASVEEQTLQGAWARLLEREQEPPEQGSYISVVRKLQCEPPTMSALQKATGITATDLGALLDAGEGAVVTLEAGQTRLAAHRAVLAARSPVFAAMFAHDTQEASSGVVTIPDAEGAVLRQLVSYLYTLQTPELPDMAAQLLAAADKYGLSDVKAECERQVARQLTVETAAATAVLAVRHSCDSLRQVAVKFVKNNFVKVASTQGWADAMLSQPKDLIEVSRLLSAPPAEIRGLSSEERDRRLIEAAKEGAVEELESLLEAGADVEARDGGRETPLHWAAIRGHVEAARHLLAAGAAVEVRNSVQSTPLLLAAGKGHVAVARLLLAFGAYHSARNQCGRTPLHVAARDGHREMAALLLEAGADREARNNSGETPLDLARRNNHQQLVDLLMTTS